MGVVLGFIHCLPPLDVGSHCSQRVVQSSWCSCWSCPLWLFSCLFKNKTSIVSHCCNTLFHMLDLHLIVPPFLLWMWKHHLVRSCLFFCCDMIHLRRTGSHISSVPKVICVIMHVQHCNTRRVDCCVPNKCAQWPSCCFLLNFLWSRDVQQLDYEIPIFIHDVGGGGCKCLQQKWFYTMHLILLPFASIHGVFSSCLTFCVLFPLP